MGTGGQRKWKSMDHLLRALPPLASSPIRFLQQVIGPDGKMALLEVNPGNIWDPQTYLLDGRQYLYAGVTTPVWNEEQGQYAEANISRRIKVAEYDAKLKAWVFHYEPVFGTLSFDHWLGHCYGHQLVWNDGRLYMMHDEVSREVNLQTGETQPGSGVFATEIFLREMHSPLRASETATKIQGIEDLPLELTRRSSKIGGYLIEGPRYARVQVGDQELHLIWVSTRDYPTKGYSIVLLISETGFHGPYRAYREEGRVVNFSEALERAHSLHGVGRAFPFEHAGQNWLVLHGADDQEGIDHSDWDKTIEAGFERDLFLTSYGISRDLNGVLRARVGGAAQ
jgi:hypothetical protein